MLLEDERSVGFFSRIMLLSYVSPVGRYTSDFTLYGVSEYIGYKSGRGGFPHGEKSILSMFNLIV